jgi:signal transduction histidine kinase
MTHELKNVLATINENAGLLGDYSAKAGHGMPLDPEKIKTLAARITRQVKRGDELLKSMNRFSHSVDAPRASVNLNEALELLSSLAARFAAMRGITLEVSASELPVQIMTSPFLLLNALFFCLELAMEAIGSGRTIRMKPEKTESGIQIQFSPLADLCRISIEERLQERVAQLRTFLEADFVADSENEIVNLRFSNR